MSKPSSVHDELLVRVKSHAERALQRVFPIQGVSWPRPTHFAAALVVRIEMCAGGRNRTTRGPQNSRVNSFAILLSVHCSDMDTHLLTQPAVGEQFHVPGDEHQCCLLLLLRVAPCAVGLGAAALEQIFATGCAIKTA